MPIISNVEYNIINKHESLQKLLSETKRIISNITQ